ncbi:hypothetical protein OED01_12275 [Microbacterium sp. M28]|uniref:hypothetical protein n=1 Tax=Microbacterium sp. M28 TaxID=2962064 RepID=UPI0021F4443F|nr:hypothetical protein [Microbacterium sp. M28]UYO96373.1 hypothetical protein OED01_12275 [Microbacterium sp. M28]
MYDYSIFSKNRRTPAELAEASFDVLVSAFNDSERVRRVFDLLPAAEKYWVVHSEYGYADGELPSEACWTPDPRESEIEAWERCFSDLAITPDAKIAIDITGMMRPHLLLLPLMLQRAGFKEATLLYSDPVSYVSGQATTFTKGPVERVAVVPGYAGAHRTSIDARDCLIIGAGYDHELVKAVAESKRNADHYVLVGMPGLQPHMYQESVYRISQAKESINDFRSRSLLYAPANNPFMTAQVLSDHLTSLRRKGEVDNVYLAPVGPKSQVLGFAWYFLCEGLGTPTSILFPYAQRYSRETSAGLSAIHEYKLELDAIVRPGGN